jgi:DNA-binding MarR family transcriptional regulator
MAKKREPFPYDPIAEASMNWQAKGWADGALFGAAISIARAAEIVADTTKGVLGAYRLTPTSHEVLMVLYFTSREQMLLGQISRLLMLHPTSVTNVMDKLEEEGLVERVAHPTDRRATYARITDAGKAAAEASSAKLAESGMGLACLEPAECDQLVEILRRVRYAAGDYLGDEIPDREISSDAPSRPPVGPG